MALKWCIEHGIIEKSKITTTLALIEELKEEEAKSKIKRMEPAAKRKKDEFNQERKKRAEQYE